MASLQVLLTALIRLIGFYYIFRAVDMILASMTYYSSMSDLENNFEFSSLTYILIQLIFAVVIFLSAPKLAQLMVGETEAAKDVDLSITVILCTGVVIIAWGVSKVSDLIHGIVHRSSINPDGSLGELSFELSTSDSLYILTSFIMILGGIYIIIKCDKIGTKFLRKK